MEDVEVLMDQNYPHECIKKIIDWRVLNPLQEARTLSTDVFQDVRRRREEAPLEDSRENLNSIFSMDTLVTYLVYTRTRIHGRNRWEKNYAMRRRIFLFLLWWKSLLLLRFDHFKYPQIPFMVFSAVFHCRAPARTRWSNARGFHLPGLGTKRFSSLL